MGDIRYEKSYASLLFLRADAGAEQRAVELALTRLPELAQKPWLRKFPLVDPDFVGDAPYKQAQIILDLCNNHPDEHSWSIGESFERLKTKRPESPLTRAKVRFDIDETLGSAANPKYRRRHVAGDSDAEEIFDFWTSVRFGPLTHK